MRTQRKLLSSCFTHWENYLQCVSSATGKLPMTFQDQGDINMYMHTLPCGLGKIHPRSHSRKAVFRIIVEMHFHINVTFHHFHLPMAVRRLGFLGFYEYVMFTNDIASTASDHIFIGRRSPFWVKWNKNLLFVKYGTTHGYPSVGSFTLHYQVCDTHRKSLFVNRLFGTTIHRFANSSTTIGITDFNFWPVSEYLSFYTFHIIGSKMRALDLSVDISHLYRGHLNAIAYEGPVPVEDYKHPDTRYLSQGQWIYFLTFQSFLQLWCTTQNCKNLHVRFAWVFVVDHSTIFSAPTNQKVAYPSKQCEGNQLVEGPSSLIFCSYVFVSLSSKYLQVSLEEVWFEGFDFGGNYSSDDTCLIAGITLVDMARYHLLMTPERYVQETGQPLQESIIDNVFPEITICHLIPFVENSANVAFKLPMTKFTTTTSGLLVIIYAYGHHLDLKTSRVSITVSEMSTIGLFLNCPIVEKDGLLQYNTDSIRNDLVAVAKRDRCPLGKTMLVYFIKLGRVYSIKIMYCTSNMFTQVIIISPSFENMVIQTNFDPRSPQAPECHILETDIKQRAVHSYVIMAEQSHSMLCSMLTNRLNTTTLVGVAVFHNSSMTDANPHGSSSLNNFVYMVSGFKVHIHTYYQCIQLYINVRSSCQKLKTVPRADLSTKIVEGTLSNQEYSSACTNYELPVFNETLEVNTYEFHISQDFGMDIVQTMVAHDIDIGRLSAEILNKEIPAYQLGVTLTVAHCLDSCKHFELSIAYKEAATGKLVWLQWSVYLGESYVANITITQIPLNGWLVFVTQLQHRLPCADEQNRCEQSIRFDTYFTPAMHGHAHPLVGIKHDNHDLVAHLYYLWTQQPHTWNEAESNCRAQGMHLVSLASETEYLILLDLLLGESPSKSDGFDISILTPCKLETSLCAIYIGMQIKVRVRQ